jgi:hypothetical protein
MVYCCDDAGANYGGKNDTHAKEKTETVEAIRRRTRRNPRPASLSLVA